MRVVFEDEYVRVTLDDPPGVTRYVRSAVRWPSVEVLERSFEALLQAQGRVPAGTALLVDVRDALGRNDEAYESTFRRYREPFFSRFRRVATLVATPVGALQVKRLRGENPSGTQVEPFTDEAEALRYLLDAPRG